MIVIDNWIHQKMMSHDANSGLPWAVSQLKMIKAGCFASIMCHEKVRQQWMKNDSSGYIWITIL